MSLHTQCLPRIARTWSHRTQWRRIAIRCYASTTVDEQAWFQQLRREMLGRPLPSSREYLNVTTDRKLIDTLSTFLPQEWCHRSKKNDVFLTLGHHLVWFNTSMPADQLLPDGTDPLQSPGAPWVRRMWAGGHLKLRRDAYYDSERGFAIKSDMVCAERIQDVQLRGQGDAAKIFVTIERRLARNDTLHAKLELLRAKYGRRAKQANPQWQFREQLLDEDWGDAILIEERNLVFLKEKTPAEVEAIKAGQLTPIKYLDSPGKPDFSHSLVPTRLLLFRYSALTFNAHLIHLDREYARSVEGHRNLLVHGPLSLTLMLQTMSGYVEEKTGGQHVLESIKYRNLAPLYCDEEMRICCRVKRSSDDGDLYDVWIEGPTGGVAVMGTLRTVGRPATEVKRQIPVSQTVNNNSGSQETDSITKEQPRIRYVNDTSGKGMHTINERNNVATRKAPVIRRVDSFSSKVIPSGDGDEKIITKEDLSIRDVDGAGTLVRPASRDPASPALDPKPRNRRSQMTVKRKDFLVMVSSRRMRRHNPASKLSLSNFTMPSVPQSDDVEQPSTLETTSSAVSDESTLGPIREPRRAYRRNRPARASSTQTIIPHVRRVEAPPSPMKYTVTPITRKVLRRIVRPEASTSLRSIFRPESTGPLARPTPLVRTYRGKEYNYDPTTISTKHSRYRREGVRKIEKPRIVRVARARRLIRR